jgi:hypothetical protein
MKWTCVDHRTSSDAQRHFRHAPGIRGANISEKGATGPDLWWTPFGLGVMGRDEQDNPGRLLREALAGRYYGVYEGVETFDGEKLSKVTIGKSKDVLAVTFWIDPGRGFLPIRTIDRATRPGSLLFLSVIREVKQCSGGRWFPMRAIVVDDPTSTGRPLRARAFRVLELDVDHPPADDLLAVDLPGGTQVAESGGDPASFLVFQQPERVRVDGLATLLERCRAQIPYWRSLQQDALASRSEKPRQRKLKLPLQPARRLKR